MGPLFQIIYFLLVKELLPLNDLNLFASYHYSILIFNLLPIYPLDGGKFLKLFFDKILPFKKSMIYIIIISLIIDVFIIIISINKYPLNILFMFILVLVKLKDEIKKRNYYFNKFLLERLLNNFSFKKRRIIEKVDDMYRDNYHIIKRGNKYYTEHQYLKDKYN